MPPKKKKNPPKKISYDESELDKARSALKEATIKYEELTRRKEGRAVDDRRLAFNYENDNKVWRTFLTELDSLGPLFSSQIEQVISQITFMDF